MASDDPRDLYKSVILRNNLSRVFRRDRDAEFAKVLASLSEADNEIGGIYGKHPFGETVVPYKGRDKSLIREARDQMFNDTATGQYQTVLGGNYGVPRPRQAPFDDELYRKIIPILAWLPKTPILVAYRLAEAIFGTQESLGLNKWEFYEVNPNEIIFELPATLITGSNANATYLHGYHGLADVGAFATSITSVGVDASKSADNLVGLKLYLYEGAGWNDYEIMSHSFDPDTNENTFGLDGETTGEVPQEGLAFFIDIPAVNSYDGDHMLEDASEAAGDPNPDSDVLVYLFGKGKLDIFEFYVNEFVRASGVVLRSVML